MDLPNEIITLIFNNLDVIDSLHLMSTCWTLYDFPGLEDKIEAGLLMNDAYTHNDYGSSDFMTYTITPIMSYASKKGYLDIIKKIIYLDSDSNADDLEKRLHNNKFNPTGLELYIQQAFDNNHRNVGLYLLNHLGTGYHKFNEGIKAAAKYSLLNNDNYVIKKLIKLDIELLSLIVETSCLTGNYDMFIKYHNLCKQICACSYRNFIIKGDYTYDFHYNGCKIVNDKVVPRMLYGKRKTDLDTVCGCYYNKLKPYTDILYISVIGGNKEIVNYLIEHGEKDYESGLQAAAKTNNLYFIDLFKEKLRQ
jgi:hypothetical protein